MCPRTTSSKTEGMSASGTYSTLLPNFRTAAAWLNVPTGPRNPIRSGLSSANDPLISSRYTASRHRSGSGPWFSRRTFSRTIFSRSGA